MKINNKIKVVILLFERKEMELNLDRNNSLHNNELNIENAQEKFIETNLGKAIDFGLDIGLRAVLPNAIEDTVINIKDVIMENGLKDGVGQIIENVVDIGKSITGLIKGDFSNIDELKNTLVSGGIFNSVSTLVDFSIDKLQPTSTISETLIDVVKSGKEYIFNNIEQSVEQSFKDQSIAINKIEKSISKWENAFENKDIKTLEKEFSNITSELNGIMPIRDLILKTEEIKNIQILLKNNGNNFDLSTEKLEIAKKMMI